MYKKDEKLISQWSDRMVEQEDDGLILDFPFDYPREIFKVDMAMRALVKSKRKLFIAKNDRGRTFLEIDDVAKAIRACANIDYLAIREFYSRHKLSPYFELLADEFITFRAAVIKGPRVNADLANEWVKRIREEARSEAFARILNTQERNARKNARSVTEYINNLQAVFARLCVVRVDLGYDRRCRQTVLPSEVDPVRMKRELATLLRVLRVKYPALVGYVWKLEYGQGKSYHIHLMTIFNGHEVRQDVSIGRAIGERWCEEITGGNGGYWNCNANKEFYERINRFGIGMVAYDDVEKRKRLRDAVLYLAKADYYVKLNEPSIGRIFGKGQVEAAGTIKVGRPRRRAA